MSGGLVWTVAVWLIPLTIAIVFHEVAHGLAARAFGDETAARLGRLSLNPVRHVDPVGTIGLPLVLAMTGAPIFGWAKPVPVVAARMRNPRRDMMLVALAGPATNAVLALASAALLALVVAGGPVPEGGVAGFLAANLFNLVLVNVFLGVFNLLPVPPFDGGHVVEGLLPRRLLPAWARLARLAMPILLVLLLVLPMLSPSLNVVARAVAPVAGGVVSALFALVGLA